MRKGRGSNKSETSYMNGPPQVECEESLTTAVPPLPIPTVPGRSPRPTLAPTARPTITPPPTRPTFRLISIFCVLAPSVVSLYYTGYLYWGPELMLAKHDKDTKPVTKINSGPSTYSTNTFPYQADHKDSAATRAAQPARQPVPHHGVAVLHDGPARLPAGHHSHAEKPLHHAAAECWQVGD